MIILAVDTELTDLGEDAEIIEMGGVLYDTVRKIVLSSYGQIYKTINESVELAAECHGISREVSLICPSIDECPNPWEVLRGDMAEYIVAHNAPCDHPVVTNAWPKFLQKPWLCTQRDLRHSNIVKNVSSRRLGHLCVDYKIGTGVLHRAQEDARMCAIIAGMHDLDEAYKLKIAPRFRLICCGDFIKGFDAGKELRKSPSSLKDNRWYRWNDDAYPKCWMKPGLLEEDLKNDAAFIKEKTNGRWEFNVERMDPKPY
jgi:DNA polymerase III epsilon subunit-like protein